MDTTFQSGSKGMMQNRTVIKVEPNKKYRWKIHVALLIHFSGEKKFTIEIVDG